MATPDFVVIGHVVRDIVPGGWRLGGTATFAALQAQRLSRNAGIITSAADELDLVDALPGIMLSVRPSSHTTTFENVYDAGSRRQRVLAQAEPLTPEQLPADWEGASIFLLGPVCGEVSPDYAGYLPDALVGVSAQGWLRELDEGAVVRLRPWSGPSFWHGCRVLFVSEEDLGGCDDELEGWASQVPVVVLTGARLGARVYVNGAPLEIAAFPAREADPTGAGDVFAAAFLVRYSETEDAAESARFASAAAACSVEATGVEAIAGRGEIEARMNAHPEIVLR